MYLSTLSNPDATDGGGRSTLSTADLQRMRIPYALHRVPHESFACVLPHPKIPQPGDIVLAIVESIGRNTRLELSHGRNCALHKGHLVAAVFGNRYATQQFEGYARIDGDHCDLLSMGGLCGLVASKHGSMAEPTRLRVLGALGDEEGNALRLGDFGLPPVPMPVRPRRVVVCGSSMDAGKTYPAMSLIIGLRQRGHRVAGIKLTGTAAGKDTWNMIDAGANCAFNFVDGGYPSTYLCPLEELLALDRLLVAHAATLGAEWVVTEIADGLFQRETSALLQSPEFVSTVDGWVFAVGDALAAAHGVSILRNWGIQPLAISGVISMSPLGMQEAAAATGVACLKAEELQRGWLDDQALKVGRDCLPLPIAGPTLTMEARPS